MRGQVGWGLLFVFLIILALFVLAMALPIILRSIGLQEWGNLIDKLQNLQKYKNEYVTLSLPSYVSSIGFYPAENGKCREEDAICRGLCTDMNGKPMEGKGFITISIDPNSKPSTLSVLWSAATFQIEQAKAQAAQMAVTEMCMPKDYALDFRQFSSGSLTAKYLKSDALVLKGGGAKSYCLKPHDTTNGFEIGVISEGACSATGG